MHQRALSIGIAYSLLLLTSRAFPQALSDIPTSVTDWTDKGALPTGGALFDGNGKHYLARVIASRRDTPGAVELHQSDADLLCVLEGSATLVTGGSILNRREVSSIEVTGTGIEGGDSRELAKGDVVFVPRGTPHWFRSVAGTISYLAIKVRDDASPTRPAEKGYWAGATIFPSRATVIDRAGYPIGQVQVVVRTGIGRVELHEADADLFFIFDGSASVVVGGTILGERSTGLNQRSGESITGGEERQVTSGDVVLIPRSTPHQFVRVDKAVRYLAIKMR